MSNMSQPRESVYFSSLSQLDEWWDNRDRLPITDNLRISREKLDSYCRRYSSASGDDKPVLQIIHDFKNGYQPQQDADPLGYYPSTTSDYYLLQFPRLCDEFIYFSHHRISVPPISWVTQCHKNGIVCLGTIIFEGKSPLDFNELDRLLQKEPDGVHFKYVNLLVQLCQHYNFEGYLINIETRFSHSELGLELTSFVSSLKAELKLYNKFSRLIWYDAYTARHNKVKYGNGVTDDNYEYLWSSDAMLTNYWWKQENLETNIQLAGTKANVINGVDVWGRGMKYGNGGFETAIAMEKLSQYSNKFGLFAPAWTFEYFNPQDFVINDCKFWLSPGKAKRSISDIVKSYSSPVYIPRLGEFIFYTNFSQGHGQKIFENGVLVFNNMWINGSLTFEIPQIYFDQLVNPTTSADDLKFQLYHKDAFHLGTSLKIDKSIEDEIPTSRLLLKKFSGGQKIRKVLFELNQPVHDSLSLKISYKYLSSSKTHFFIVVTYEISHSLHLSRTAETLIPVANKGNKWTILAKSLKLPLHSSLEKVVLKSIGLEFQELPGLQQSENVTEEWVIVENQRNHLKYKTLSLLLGDISLNGTSSDGLKTNRISKVNTAVTSSDGKLELEWDTTKDPLYWNIMVDDQFWGSSVVPYVILDRNPTKVRIDIVNRDGECIIGDSILLE